MANKFYVVWKGRQTGIFTDWATCKKQVDQFPGARYKSFTSRAEAEAAFAGTSRPARSPKGAALARTPSLSKLAATGRKPARNSVKTYSCAEITALTASTKIFTDGGCEPNPGKAGSGLALYRGDRLAELWYGLYNPHGTNNTAELNALHQALLMAEQELKAGASVAILCDSKYAIQCISQWAPGWQKKGWVRPGGGEIKNLTLIQTLFALYQKLKADIELLHVNGHVGVEGNELADRMSILAVDRKEPYFRQYAEPLDIAAILALRAG